MLTHQMLKSSMLQIENIYSCSTKAMKVSKAVYDDLLCSSQTGIVYKKMHYLLNKIHDKILLMELRDSLLYGRNAIAARDMTLDQDCIRR